MKKVLIAATAALAVLACLSQSVHAQRAPEGRPIPNYDKRALLPSEARLAPPGRVAAEARLQGLLPEVRVSADPYFLSPRFIYSRQGFLSGPNAQGGAITAQAAAAVPANDPHRPVLAFVSDHRALFGFGPEALAAARVDRDYVTPHNGLRTTVWQQQVDGVDVLDAKFIGNITRNGELVNLSSRFVPDPAAAANVGLPNRVAGAWPAAFAVSAAQGVVNAAAAISEQIALADVQAIDAVPLGSERKQRFNALPKINGETAVELKWFALTPGELRPAWQVILSSRARGEMFMVVVDAQNGEALLRRCLTQYLTNATYNVYTNDSPAPWSPGPATPSTVQAPFVARQLVTLSALNTNASPNGWINDGVNETLGNNVDAHMDWDNDNQPDLPRPAGNPNRTFDFPLDVTQQPTNWGPAAVVQLFYLCNMFHDRLYELGFNEAAGNFQTDNFGRGGLGNDAVLADAQDGVLDGQVNNANFATPPDGTPGRMQMYVFDFPTPNRDGDLEAAIVYHEHTHGLSWRMVAGGQALGTLQSDGMGEGWSDFYALGLLAEPGDDVNGTYSTGGYATYQLAGLLENYYYGIRRYPYCTDMSKNPLTFKDIDPTQASAHTGVPLSPIFSPFDPSGANEVHNAGEVWCATLWEVYAKMVTKYGFTNGNRLALQMVTDGMRLSPAQPNFLEARDAIIQADQVNNGGANYLELWQAFSKRGMGGSASSPPSSSTIGLVEAFDLPGLAINSVTVSDANSGNGNGVIDFNECNELTIVLVNNGINTASNITAVLSTTTVGVVLAQPDGSYPNLPRGARGTNAVPFKISTLPSFLCGTPIDLVLNVRATNDYRALKFRLGTGKIGTPVKFDSAASVAIPDADPLGVESPITVSGFNSAVSKVTVSLHATHPFVFDLTMQLIAPDGSHVLLVQNNPFFGANFGTACSPESSRTTFDDKASTPITGNRPPYVGTFRPLQPLDLFVGKNGLAANGVWRLRVLDAYRFDVGTLDCWSLYLSPTLCSDGGGDCSTDVALGKSAAPALAMIGSNLVYTLSVTNLGPNAARGVSVSDPLPPGVTFVNATASQGSCSFSAGAVECNLGTLQVNQVGTIRVTVRPTAEGFVTNTASLVSTVSDSRPANNVATVVTRVIPPSPVIEPFYTTLVSESATPANGGLDPGETVTVNFRLHNVGSLATTNLIAKLLATGGVTVPSGQQNYGAVLPFGPAVGRDFTFTATGTNGGLVVASLLLQDGANNLGTVTFAFGLSVVRTYANQGVINIPSSGAATPYPSAINVLGFNGLASKVSIILSNLTHSFPQDIDALVVAPSGQKVMLLSDAGGGTPVNNLVATFDDAAVGVVPQNGPFTSGAYRPTDYEPGDIMPAPAPAAPYVTALSAFNGFSPNGIWQLFVNDDTPGDDGRIGGGWQLNLSIVDPVNPNADLGVSVVDAPDPVGIGSNLTYAVVVTNNGSETAYEVMLTNTLPAGIAFLSVTNTAGACTVAGSQVVCAFDSITNRGVVVVTIVGNAAASGAQLFTTRVSGASLVDFNLANNTAIASTTVSASADLRVTLLALPNPVSVLNALTYSLVVSNAGPNNASGVSLTNVLPAGVAFVSATATQGSCNHAAGVVTCALGSLAKNASASIALQVTTPAAVSVLTYVARVGALTPPDPIASNNLAVVVVANLNPNYIIQPAWALLESESGPLTGGIDPGETVTVSFALRNVGSLPTANLVATLLPSGGVTLPGAAQDYAVLAPNGPAVARSFSFTATGTPGSVVTATLRVVDGATDLGKVQFQFPLGASARFVSTNAISIPDRGPALTYPSTITVSGFAGVVSKVSVTLSNLTHAYPDDLDILLVSPSGQKVMVMSDAGGGVGATNLTLSFDDSAPTPLPDSTALSSGLYRPTDFEPGDVMPLPAPAGPYANTLAAFNGGVANGGWSLYIADDSYGDSGALHGGWSLSLATVGSLVPLPPQLSAPRLPNKVFFGFTLTGQTGVTYLIQGSDDLNTWTPVETITLVGTTYDYVTPTGAAHRFYRAWRVP